MARAWFVWGLGAAFYFYEFVLQVSPSVMVQDLMKAFPVNAAALGGLAAFYFYAYASMQIPVGILLDRLGARKLLTLATLVCATGCLLFATAHALDVARIGRTLIGLGGAFAAVGCMSLAIRWFPPRHFAALTGLMLTIGMLGAAGGEAPLAIIVNNLGWRHSMAIFAFAGLVLALLIFLVVRDSPRGQVPRITPKPQDSLITGLKAVLASRQSGQNISKLDPTRLTF